MKSVEYSMHPLQWPNAPRIPPVPSVVKCTPYTPCALCGEMHPVYPLCPLWWNAPRIPPTSAVVECTPYISYILRSRSERVMSVSFPRYPLSVTWAMCDVGELWGLCGY